MRFFVVLLIMVFSLPAVAQEKKTEKKPAAAKKAEPKKAAPKKAEPKKAEAKKAAPKKAAEPSQDWGRFKLDAFFPMLYSSFYEAGPEFVRQYTEEAVRSVKAPVYSGLYVDPLSAADFTRSVEVARAAGASGVSIFDFGAMTDERWRLLQRAIAG